MWESLRLGTNCWLPDSLGDFECSSGKGRRGKASLEVLIAAPSALKGSVDFGPEVTSSDRSLKVLLNAEDKVRVWVLAVDYPGATVGPRPWARLWEGRLSLWERDPPQERAYPGTQ